MGQEFENLLTSMQQEVGSIETNRRERNQKYLNCINEYMDHLKTEIQQFQTGQPSNAKCKEQISQAFKISYERILQGVSITEMHIKQTYQEKIKFWRVSKALAELLGSGKLKIWCHENNTITKHRFHEVLFLAKKQKSTYEQLFIQKPNPKHQLRQHQNVNRAFEEQALQGNMSVNRSQAKMKTSKQPQAQLSRNELYQQGTIETNFLDDFMIDRR